MKIIYVCCPICSMSRVLDKKGSRAEITHKLDPSITPKGRVRLDVMDFSRPFIQVREAVGGKVASTETDIERQLGKKVGRGKLPGGGFRLVDGITLEEAAKMPEYSDLVEQLREQCQAILKILK